MAKKVKFTLPEWTRSERSFLQSIGFYVMNPLANAKFMLCGKEYKVALQIRAQSYGIWIEQLLVKELPLSTDIEKIYSYFEEAVTVYMTAITLNPDHKFPTQIEPWRQLFTRELQEQMKVYRELKAAGNKLIER